MNLSEWLESSDLEDVIRRLQVDVTHLESKNASQATLPPAAPFTARNASSYPQLTDLKLIYRSLVQELQATPEQVLKLNRSRREAIHHHLKFLRPESKEHPPKTLEEWVEHARSDASAARAALNVFFEETALVWLAQALVLKVWEEKGLRPLQAQDLREPAFQLYQQLLPKMVGSKPWQITQSNFYSWFRPSVDSLNRVFDFFTKCESFSKHGALVDVLLSLRETQPHRLDVPEFDSRFMEALWNFLFSVRGPIAGRNGALAFSPTLRMGNWVRHSPREIGWVGLEWNLFRLLMAEVTILERSLQPAPLWLQGTGLELFSKDQMEFGLSSPRNLALGKLCELECFDFAYVLEERIQRVEDKGLHSDLFKEHLSQFSSLKGVVAPGTSLGDLQALIALTKLRPGGCFAWLRSEPLSARDGEKVLQQFLGKATLLCEWNFSGLEHQLPTKLELFPKYLYLFKRELQSDARKEHHPVRVIAKGHLRSHVDLTPMLEESFRALAQESQSNKSWKLIRHASPIPQSEWAQRWPEAKDQNELTFLDRLREHCLPLGQVAQVRPYQPKKDQNAMDSLLPERELSNPNTLYVGIAMSGASAGKSIRVKPRIDETFDAKALLLLPSSAWAGPVMRYLESPIAHVWLTHHCERRSGNWVLKEQTLKALPFPKAVAQAIEHGPHAALKDTDPLLHGATLLQWLENTPNPSEGELASLFVKASETLHWVEQQEGPVTEVLNPDGTIRWSKGFELLPRKDLVPFRLHSEVQIVGMLPPQAPIVMVKPVQSPRSGILLATENHMSAQIVTGHALVQEMLLSQLMEFEHPTWNELNQRVSLPRNLELASQTASEVLQFLYQQKARLADLSKLCEKTLGRCLNFRPLPQPPAPPTP